MTREEILAMPAGPEMDAIVAVRVMGERPCALWQVQSEEDGERAWMHAGRWCDPPCYNPAEPYGYSKYIGQAWRVLEKLMERGLGGVLAWGRGEFRVGDRPPCDSYDCMEFGNHNHAEPQAEPTPALAICRAALLATFQEK